MVADQRYDSCQVREALAAVAYPLQRAVDFPSRLEPAHRILRDRGRLRQENLELTARLRLANLQLQRFAALEDENRRLRDMRESSAGVAERVLVASILNVELDPFRHRVLVDKGSADGVFKGQAVLDAEGIFGQVAKVHPRSAEVILISDASTPSRCSRTAAACAASRSVPATPAASRCRSSPWNRTSRAGDLLIFHRHGRRVPGRLPGRRGHALERDPAATFAVVDARPTARLDARPRRAARVVRDAAGPPRLPRRRPPGRRGHWGGRGDWGAERGRAVRPIGADGLNWLDWLDWPIGPTGPSGTARATGPTGAPAARNRAAGPTAASPSAGGADTPPPPQPALPAARVRDTAGRKRPPPATTAVDESLPADGPAPSAGSATPAAGAPASPEPAPRKSHRPGTGRHETRRLQPPLIYWASVAAGSCSPSCAAGLACTLRPDLALLAGSTGSSPARASRDWATLGSPVCCSTCCAA